MEENKKPHCPDCVVPDDAIEKLKNSATEVRENRKEKKEATLAKALAGRRKKRFIFWSVILLVATGLIFGGIKLNSYFVEKQANSPKITVYYSTTCGCCKQWITYMRAKGFNVEAIADGDILSVKDQYNVPGGMEGCHTSVINGYVVEGMVPYQAINKMLADKPRIDGIALPGMPNEAPGMPGFDGSHLTVYALDNGSSSEFQY